MGLRTHVTRLLLVLIVAMASMSAACDAACGSQAAKATCHAARGTGAASVPAMGPMGCGQMMAAVSERAPERPQVRSALAAMVSCHDGCRSAVADAAVSATTPGAAPLPSLVDSFQIGSCREMTAFAPARAQSPPGPGVTGTVSPRVLRV